MPVWSIFSQGTVRPLPVSAKQKYAALAVINGEKRVRVVRELGASTTVRVTTECSNMCCNCESFTRWRICRHVAWLRVLHYEKYPSGVVSDSEDGWSGIKDKLREILRKTHIIV